MKLIFDGITLGGGNIYFLEDYKGFDGDLKNITVKVPRTDFSRSIADSLEEKIRVFSGVLIGSDINDFKTKKRALGNRLRKTYDFTLQDDVLNPDGTTTIFATYKFRGKIVDADVNIETRSNYTKYAIQIFSEDPFLYLDPEIDETIQIQNAGFIFPLTFPLVFTGLTNSITVTNDGTEFVYPTITITGPGTNFSIINQTSDELDKEFKYNSSLADGETLVITPIPTDEIKIRKDGVSVIGLTNSNFEALKLKPGVNTLLFLVETNNSEDTTANIIFNSAFMAI